MWRPPCHAGQRLESRRLCPTADSFGLDTNREGCLQSSFASPISCDEGDPEVGVARRGVRQVAYPGHEELPYWFTRAFGASVPCRASAPRGRNNKPDQRACPPLKECWEECGQEPGDKGQPGPVGVGVRIVTGRCPRDVKCLGGLWIRVLRCPQILYPTLPSVPPLPDRILAEAVPL
jgi:hypothetical protein